MTYSNQARDIIHMLFEINEFQLIKVIGVGRKAKGESDKLCFYNYSRFYAGFLWSFGSFRK